MRAVLLLLALVMSCGQIVSNPPDAPPNDNFDASTIDGPPVTFDAATCDLSITHTEPGLDQEIQLTMICDNLYACMASSVTADAMSSLDSHWECGDGCGAGQFSCNWVPDEPGQTTITQDVLDAICEASLLDPQPLSITCYNG